MSEGENVQQQLDRIREDTKVTRDMVGTMYYVLMLVIILTLAPVVLQFLAWSLK